MAKNKLWTSEEDEILRKHYSSSSKEVICSLLSDREWNGIKQHAYGKLKLEKKEFTGRTKNGFPERLLEDTLVSYYWIGFLLADGSFGKDGRIVLSLADKDKLHLEKFALFLGSPVSSSTRKTNFSASSLMHKVSVLSTYYGEQIKEKFGIVANKTENPPLFTNYLFSKEQLLALIVGFIDGDGYIVTKKDRHRVIKIEIHSLWKSNLEWIETQIYSYFHTYSKKVDTLTRINSKGYASLNITNSKVVEEIKQFAITNKLPFLERKWNG